jgi:hypothetical protein
MVIDAFVSPMFIGKFTPNFVDVYMLADCVVCHDKWFITISCWLQSLVTQCIDFILLIFIITWSNIYYRNKEMWKSTREIGFYIWELLMEIKIILAWLCSIHHPSRMNNSSVFNCWMLILDMKLIMAALGTSFVDHTHNSVMLLINCSDFVGIWISCISSL